jgi:maltose-binding protein MalE
MRFLTEDAEAQARLDAGGQLVANAAPYDTPQARADGFVRAFREQVGQTVSLSNRPHMRAVWTPMKAALSKGIVHGEAPDAVLRDAAASIRRATE